MQDKTELATLVRDSLVKTVRSKELTIRRIPVGRLPAFARALAPVLAGQGLSSDAFNEQDLLRLMAEHGDSIIDAATIALEVDRQWVESLDVDEFIGLVMDIVEVNGDFFTRRVLPAIEAATTRMAAMAATGRTSSSSSSPTATGDATS